VCLPLLAAAALAMLTACGSQHAADEGGVITASPEAVHSASVPSAASTPATSSSAAQAGQLPPAGPCIADGGTLAWEYVISGTPVVYGPPVCEQIPYVGSTA
jgi:hypothetical protein